MTPEDFVRAIEASVRDSAIKSTMANLQTPPASRPEFLRISQWYQSMSISEREMIELIVRRAANFATFGFLVVLDGDRPIEAATEKGNLELSYVRDNVPIRLNDARKDGALHDMFLL